MTTNRPEKLDEALIRPGRVDHQVAFGNATQHQIKELFQRMYTTDLPITKLIDNNSSVLPPNTEKRTLKETARVDKTSPPPSTPIRSIHNGSADGRTKGLGNEKVEEVQGEELTSIASAFASKVPDDMFSPAEIQGFLLKRKKDPRKALSDVDSWVQGMVEMKGSGTKLVKVQ